METKNDQTTTPIRINISKIVGYVLLIPPFISIGIFLAQLFSEETLYLEEFLSTIWTGDYYGEGGGFTSALPFYFGLMAIAGAYLIKDSNRNNNQNGYTNRGH
jgi:hypothetical protein